MDLEIIQWEKRLADQVRRGWDNYKHLHIDLSTIRLDEPVRVSGEYLYVEQSSSASAVAKIKLNRNTNDALDLEKGVKIETVFIEVYITNDALEDEWLDLVFGINFKYKKKIVNEAAGPFMFTTGGPFITPAGVDLVITPGAGGLLIVNSMVRFWGSIYQHARLYHQGDANACLMYYYTAEIIIIPVGQGAAGIVTAGNLAPADSTILGVVCRVIQAPGGGATTLDIGRTGAGNLDEFIDGIGTVLGTTGTFAANHDAITTGPIFNEIDRTLTLTTDANVLVSDMRVRVELFYRQEIPPVS